MKHYLIDSENVGDFWIPLLDLPAGSAELIVFYTKNSPHMSYDSLIKLKQSDRHVTFIKCYEGTNALDFQLCSELGYLIAMNEDDDFIIVTNDTGYDAAVKYWRRKEYSVKRIAGKDSRTGSRRRGNTARSDVAAEVSSILSKLNQTAGLRAADEEEEENVTILEDGAASVMPEESDPEEYDTEDYDPEDLDAEDSDSEDSEEYDPEDSEEYDAEDPDLEDADSEEYDAEDSDAEDYDPEDFDHEGSDDEDYDPESDDAEDPDQEDHDPEEYVQEGSEDPECGEPDQSVTKTDRLGRDARADFEEEDGSSDDEGVTETDQTGTSDGTDEQDMAEADDAYQEERTPEPDQEEEEFHADPDEVTAIVNCIGMENLAELHNQLIQFYGENGKDVYKSLKSLSPSIENKNWSKEEKFLYYCVLILRHSDEPEEALEEENVRELAQFLLGAENKRKNLNSLRYALLKHYGKEKGRRYYFMLKPYVKALNQM